VIAGWVLSLNIQKIDKTSGDYNIQPTNINATAIGYLKSKFKNFFELIIPFYIANIREVGTRFLNTCAKLHIDKCTNPTNISL
jgi:hypothetical protein